MSVLIECIKGLFICCVPVCWRLVKVIIDDHLTALNTYIRWCSILNASIACPSRKQTLHGQSIWLMGGPVLYRLETKAGLEVYIFILLKVFGLFVLWTKIDPGVVMRTPRTLQKHEKLQGWTIFKWIGLQWSVPSNLRWGIPIQVADSTPWAWSLFPVYGCYTRVIARLSMKRQWEHHFLYRSLPKTLI